jgi:hypothetical protein
MFEVAGVGSNVLLFFIANVVGTCFTLQVWVQMFYCSSLPLLWAYVLGCRCGFKRFDVFHCQCSRHMFCVLGVGIELITYQCFGHMFYIVGVGIELITYQCFGHMFYVVGVGIELTTSPVGNITLNIGIPLGTKEGGLF